MWVSIDTIIDKSDTGYKISASTTNVQDVACFHFSLIGSIKSICNIIFREISIAPYIYMEQHMYE